MVSFISKKRIESSMRLRVKQIILILLISQNIFGKKNRLNELERVTFGSSENYQSSLSDTHLYFTKVNKQTLQIYAKKSIN